MELKGRLSVVRSWKSADVPSLVKHANNINIARHLRDRFPHPYTAIDARRFVDAVVVARPVTTFAIDVGREAVGGIGFSPGSDVERFSAEIGYWLGEPYWGRGIVAEALGLVSEYAFSGVQRPAPLRAAVCRQPAIHACSREGGLHSGGDSPREQREVREAARPGALRPASIPRGALPRTRRVAVLFGSGTRMRRARTLLRPARTMRQSENVMESTR